MKINPEDFEIRNNNKSVNNSSKTRIYFFDSVNFFESDNYVIDDIDNYLDTFKNYIVDSKDYYLKINEFLTVSVKFDYRELEKFKKLNYVKIVNFYNDEEINYGYYFLKKIERSRGVNVINATLKLDILNTFLNRMHFSNSTFVIQEHINRFDFTKTNKNYLFKKIPIIYSTKEENLIYSDKDYLISNEKTISVHFYGWVKFFIGNNSQEVYFLPFSNCKIVFRGADGSEKGEIDGIQNFNNIEDYLSLINSNVYHASFVPYDFYNFYTTKYIENDYFVYVVKSSFDLEIRKDFKITGNNEKGLSDQILKKVLVVKTKMFFLNIDDDKYGKVKLFFNNDYFLENTILKDFVIPLSQEKKEEIFLGNIKNGYFGLESSLYSINYRYLEFKYPFANFSYKFHLDKIIFNCYEDFTKNFPIYFNSLLTDTNLGIIEIKTNDYFKLFDNQEGNFAIENNIQIITGGVLNFEQSAFWGSLKKLGYIMYCGFRGIIRGGRMLSPLRIISSTARMAISGAVEIVRGVANVVSNENKEKENDLKTSSTFEVLSYSDGFYIESKYYKVCDEEEKKINYDYYLYGNIVNEYKQPTHNNRRFFDYLKCEAKFINKEFLIDEDFLEKIKEKLLNGIYFIHNDNEQGYIFPTDNYENSEKDLINWFLNGKK